MRKGIWWMIILLITYLCVQFILFCHQIPPPVHEVSSLPQADAVLVFTGGFQRIQMGVHILKNQKAPHLFISGVALKSSKTKVLGKRLTEHAPLHLVTLGYAKNTQENAAELVSWAQKNDLKSIIVVTSYYHIPRSLLEINHLDHNLLIIPCPVALPGVSKLQIAYYLFSDFVKYTLLKWGVNYPKIPYRF